MTRFYVKSYERDGQSYADILEVTYGDVIDYRYTINANTFATFHERALQLPLADHGLDGFTEVTRKPFDFDPHPDSWYMILKLIRDVRLNDAQTTQDEPAQTEE